MKVVGLLSQMGVVELDDFSVLACTKDTTFNTYGLKSK